MTDDEKSNRIYIGGVFNTGVKTAIEKEINQFGKVLDVWFTYNLPGFGFVEFDSNEAATAAMNGLNSTKFQGHTLRVELSKAKGTGPLRVNHNRGRTRSKRASPRNHGVNARSDGRFASMRTPPGRSHPMDPYSYNYQERYSHAPPAHYDERYLYEPPAQYDDGYTHEQPPHYDDRYMHDQPSHYDYGYPARPSYSPYERMPPHQPQRPYGPAAPPIPRSIVMRRPQVNLHRPVEPLYCSRRSPPRYR